MGSFLWSAGRVGSDVGWAGCRPGDSLTTGSNNRYPRGNNMRSLRDWSVKVIALGLMAGAVGVWFHSPTEAKLEQVAALPQPVVSTHVLMERFHEVYYKALRDGVKTEPVDRAGWKVIEHNAVRIAEASNLVAIRKVDAKKKAAWMKYTAMNQQAAMDLYAAAKAKKFDDVGKAYAAVITSCNKCHTELDPDDAPVLKPQDTAKDVAKTFLVLIWSGWVKLREK